MSPAEMRRRYEAGAFLRELAAAQGCSRDTVKRWILRAGGTMRTRGGSRRRRKLDDSVVVDLYYTDGLSCAAIARRFGVTAQAVHLRLKRVGFARRPTNTPSPLRRRSARARWRDRAGRFAACTPGQEGVQVRATID